MVLVISSKAVLSWVAFLSTPKNHNQYQDGLHVGLVEDMEGDWTDESKEHWPAEEQQWLQVNGAAGHGGGGEECEEEGS